ncbi:MAG: hypothetical protein HQL96_06290 [Magnetococcales bacterium]|nr:hypothetical protein [Magnetococcales bacterium]
MDNLVEKLGVLKNLLQTASDIADPFEYFMSHFGENLQFMKSSQDVVNEKLFEVIKVISIKHFKYELRLEHCMFRQSPLAPRLIHGVCEVPNKIIVLFYAEELGQGMMSMVDYSEPRRVNYYRFTTLVATNGPPALHQGNPLVLH